MKGCASKTKKKFQKRIFGYLYDMKKDEESKVATRISEDIDLFVWELKTKIRERDLEINKLRKTAGDVRTG